MARGRIKYVCESATDSARSRDEILFRLMGAFYFKYFSVSKPLCQRSQASDRSSNICISLCRDTETLCLAQPFQRFSQSARVPYFNSWLYFQNHISESSSPHPLLMIIFYCRCQLITDFCALAAHLHPNLKRVNVCIELNGKSRLVSLQNAAVVTLNCPRSSSVVSIYCDSLRFILET